MFNRFQIFRNSSIIFHNTGEESFDSTFVTEFLTEEEAEKYLNEKGNGGKMTKYRTIEGIETVWYEIYPYCTLNI